MRFLTLTRIRWQPHPSIVPFLLLVLFVNSLQYAAGAPQAQFRSNSPQGKQSHFAQPAGPFRVVPDLEDHDDDDDFNSPEILSSRRVTSSGSFSGGSGRGRQQPTSRSSSFGVPLSATRSNSQHVIQRANAHFGGAARVPASRPTFSVRRSSIEDDVDDDLRFSSQSGRTSHFSVPTHKSRAAATSQRNRGRVFSDDDDLEAVSFEDIDSSIEVMSLGRRFHPQGIPKRSNTIRTKVNPSQGSRAVITNPFIVNPVDRDDSLEDDDDRVVVLSPMVRAYNHESHNERLSLSNDFLSQYNFVDVQGTTHWGYETDDQYQEHKVHDSGNMEGKFGWTAPGGSQVNIKYIADKGGYRVVSSSGLYTKDSEDVQRAKEEHFAEIDRAINEHKSIKTQRKRPTQDATSTPGAGFVVIPDDDDFPLAAPDAGVPLPGFGLETVPSRGEFGVFIDSTQPGSTSTQGETTSFGVPLPDPGTTFGSSDTAQVPQAPSSPTFGVPLPEHNVPSVGSTNFGVPLPEPTVPVTGDRASIPTTQGEFGIPLPGADQITPLAGDTTFTTSQNFGVPLPDSNIPLGPSQPSAPSSEFGVSLSESASFPAGNEGITSQSFGVPLPDPNLPLGVQKSTPSDSTFSTSLDKSTSPPSTFGVSLPDLTQQTSGDSGSLPTDSQTFGVSLPDISISSGAEKSPELSFSQGFGVPLSETGTGGAPGFSPESEIGVPLSGSFDPLANTNSVVPTSSHGFGIPLSDTVAPTGFENVSPSSAQDIGMEVVDTIADKPASPSDKPTFGVSLPDPNLSVGIEKTPEFSVTQNTGIPLGSAQSPSDQTSSQGTDVSSSAPSQPNFGVPLPGFSRPTGFDGVAITPEVSSPSQGSVGSSADTSFGISLSDSSASLPSPSASLPDSPSVDPVPQDFGVPLSNIGTGDGTFSDTTAAFDESVTSPDQGFGIPLSDAAVPVGNIESSQPPPSSAVETSISSVQSSSSSLDGVPPFGIPLSGASLNTNQQTENNQVDSNTFQSSGQEVGVSLPNLNDLTPTQGSGTFSEVDTTSVTNNEFGIPLGGANENINAGEFPSFDTTTSVGSEIPTGSVSPTLPSGNINTNFGIPLTAQNTEETQPPSFGFIPENEISHSDRFSPETPTPSLISNSNQNVVPTLPGLDNNFGIPLNFDQLGAGGSINTFTGSGNEQGFNDPSTNVNVDPNSLFGGIIGESIQNNEGVAQGNNFFNQDNVGIPLSSSNDFIGTPDSSVPLQNGGSTGISLFNDLNANEFSNTNVDLLQGPPVEQLDPSVLTEQDKSKPGLGPCQNSKLHPTLLPPECFDTPNVEPSQNIGKSLSQTSSSKSEPAQDSFIVVVNSDIFQ